MIHKRLDMERWKSLFPLEKGRKDARQFVERRRAQMPDAYKDDSAVEAHIRLMSPGGEIVTSPRHLAIVEQLRAEWLAKQRLPTVPTDVFVFATGEPQDRRTTKIGGLPFWPRNKIWPVGKSGKPMDFLAQICFADSTDLLEGLPGDLLLIFADGVYGKDWDAKNSNSLRFEWIKLPQVNLIEAADVPETRWDLYPVYGEICRTVDYLAGDARRELEKAYHQWWCVAAIEGTKVRGIPRWIQAADNVPGRFLCALGSIHPAFLPSAADMMHQQYPFTNAPGPFVREQRTFRSVDQEIQTDRLLMWDDVGSLYLFLDDTGVVHWSIQGY